MKTKKIAISNLGYGTDKKLSFSLSEIYPKGKFLGDDQNLVVQDLNEINFEIKDLWLKKIRLISCSASKNTAHAQMFEGIRISGQGREKIIDPEIDMEFWNENIIDLKVDHPLCDTDKIEFSLYVGVRLTMIFYFKDDTI